MNTNDDNEASLIDETSTDKSSALGINLKKLLKIILVIEMTKTITYNIAPNPRFTRNTFKL